MHLKLGILKSLLLFLTIGLALPVLASQAITPKEARNHVGQTATVCGSVAGTHYAASSRGRPTFINLDKPYPNQIFTVVIWGSDRTKFDRPESEYQGKNICVTGKIKEYRGIPEIVASNPVQIKVRKSK